jgi:hypothetical protein
MTLRGRSIRLLSAAVVMLSMQFAGLAFAAGSLGYQQTTSLSTSSAVGLPSIPTGAGSAVIDVEGAGIRLRDDGTDPTSSVGRPMSAGQSLCFVNDPRAIRIIGQTAGATINVTYYAGPCH